MSSMQPQPSDSEQGSCDPEEFCPDCFAGMESSEHHEKCLLAAERAEQRDRIAMILMEHDDLGRCVEGRWCRCGWAGQGHAGHVADALLHMLGDA